MQVSREDAKLVTAGLRTPPTGLDLAFEILAALTVAMAIAFLAVAWSGLPERVPTHFDASGAPDAFGSRWSLWGLAGVMVALYAVLYAMKFAPPRLWNLPFTVTSANAQAVGSLLARFSRVMNLACTALFGALLVGSVRVALGQAGGLPVWTTLIGVLLLFGALAWVLITLSRLGRGGAASKPAARHHGSR